MKINLSKRVNFTKNLVNNTVTRLKLEMTIQRVQEKRHVIDIDRLEDALYQDAKNANNLEENCQRPLGYHKPEDVVTLRFREFVITAQ